MKTARLWQTHRSVIWLKKSVSNAMSLMTARMKPNRSVTLQIMSVKQAVLKMKTANPYQTHRSVIWRRMNVSNAMIPMTAKRKLNLPVILWLMSVKQAAWKMKTANPYQTHRSVIWLKEIASNATPLKTVPMLRADQSVTLQNMSVSIVRLTRIAVGHQRHRFVMRQDTNVLNAARIVTVQIRTNLYVIRQTAFVRNV